MSDFLILSHADKSGWALHRFKCLDGHEDLTVYTSLTQLVLHYLTCDPSRFLEISFIFRSDAGFKLSFI